MNISGFDEGETSDSAKAKLEFDHRLSLGGKSQMDDQRGLLNKQDLVCYNTYIHATVFAVYFLQFN